MRARKKPEADASEELTIRLSANGEAVALPRALPLLPLRDTVLFPGQSLPLFVGRAASVATLDEASSGDRLLLAVAQRRPDAASPGREDLYQVGTIARVLQIYRLPDGTRRTLLEGLTAVRLEGLVPGEPGPRAAIGPAVSDEAGEAARAAEGPADAGEAERGAAASARQDPAREALAEAVRQAFRRYVDLDGRIPREALLACAGPAEPHQLAHRISGQLRVAVSIRQRLLESGSPERQLGLLQRILASELDRLARSRAGALRDTGRPASGVAGSRGPDAWGDAGLERPGALEGEPIGARGGDPGCSPARAEETEELAAAIEAAGMPPAVAERARRELGRLERTSPYSPEAAVSRNYLEWLIELPWHATSGGETDLARAARVLDEDHFGLERVKERILELLSVIRLSGESRGPILCLAGPPGVGKTSLGRSIARSLGRRFVRVSLGGVRDEAEIRGHRRTYVGSLPGRILQGMRRAGVIDPVFLLDEIDKLGSDHRGDPAAALLEVLDPEQNGAFNDHYLEVDYDLSRVLFVTTANLLESIPEPLRDRLEIIRIPGYLEAEKLQIARGFLVPRQIRACGLGPADLELPDATLLALARGYTREAGVRGLEREIARICRRAAKLKAGGKVQGLPEPAGGRRRRRLGLRIEPALLTSLLGAARHAEPQLEAGDRVGVADGLAWTEAGGEILSVECSVLPGRGRLLLTGKLGEIMRESAQAALSYVRSRAASLGIDPKFHRRFDVHIHLPEGAIPKDGPSAGVTIALALVSALSRVPTRASMAMTGEITLRGRVLAVGGLAEKLVAARRAGVSTVILPRANEPHLFDLPADLRAGLTLHLVERMDQVLAAGLEEVPAAGRSAAA